MPRERDVRAAIKAALVATNAFSDVWLQGLPDAYGHGASELTAAAIEPMSTRLSSGWDAGPTGGLDYTAEVTVTVLARNPDPQLCDELAEQLLNFLINAVNDQSLGGLTIPQHTRVTGWRWRPRTSGERRIAATVGFAYLVTWNSFDITP
jgi:hypothetical protein